MEIFGYLGPSVVYVIYLRILIGKQINMAMTPAQKQELIKKFGRKERDTGSPETQIALLTSRLHYLNDHFKNHKNDHHSRAGLMKLVGQRRRLLDYLKRKNPAGYKSLITDLGIRK